MQENLRLPWVIRIVLGVRGQALVADKEIMRRLVIMQLFVVLFVALPVHGQQWWSAPADLGGVALEIDPTGADCLGPSPCAFRANQVGDPNSNAPHGFEGWFNAAAFTNPVAGQTTIPSERPGAVRLPGFWRTDLAVFKNMKFTERFQGQLRLESFNTFNHLNPICCASLSTSNANYNRIRSARDPRIAQVALKLNF